MEQCIVAMLDDEESLLNGNNAATNNSRNIIDNVNGLSDSINNMSISANGFLNNGISENSDYNYSNNNSSRSYHRRFSVQDRL